MVKKSLLAVAVMLNPITSSAVPIEVFARSFLIGVPITHAQVTVLETGTSYYTDRNGKFTFDYPSGQQLTLELKKWGYKTTQSGTEIVPTEGLTGPHHNVSFQVPSLETFYLFQAAIGANLDKNACHVVTTITAHDKLLTDCPQGLDGVKVKLTSDKSQKPFYFGVFSGGMLKCKTNPFSNQLSATSVDGGVGFINLPPSNKLYTISGELKGHQFTNALFLCRKGAFINISPPRGPNEIKT